MKKKKVLKITPVLITLNILVLFAIAGFYLHRLIKYYKLENKSNEDGIVLLVDELVKKRNYLDSTKGLVFNEEEKIYRYKGEVNDNYISYSGLIYRIIGIDKDNNIKAISEENVTLMYPGFDKGYEKSYVNKWLNQSDEKNSGIFEEILINPLGNLNNTYYCTDEVSDTENITCENKSKDYKITLLSLYDYKEAGGKASYLNNGNVFNLGTLNKEKLSYYVTEEGDIAVQQKNEKAILVRPVITFDKSVEVLSGNGSKNKPYIIEKHKITDLSDTYVGNYISLNDENYRVVKKYDGKVLVVKDEILKEKDEELKINFGGSDNIYTTSDGIGKYLNKTYLNTLDLKDSVVKGDFYTGLINLSSYDYSLLKDDKVKAKVGMLTMGDMFINETYNVLTTFRGIEAEDIVYVINENGYYFGDTLNSKYNVKPALYLKDDVEIESGKGSKEKPFIFKVAQESEKGEE